MIGARIAAQVGIGRPVLVAVWLCAAGCAAMSPSVRPGTEIRQTGRYLRLSVIGGGETITLKDPLGRVAQATDTAAWSQIPACSTGVNPPARGGDETISVYGGFFLATDPLVGRWSLHVRRDAPAGRSEVPNVGVYAQRGTSSGTDMAEERDLIRLALGESMAWLVEVLPPSTPADSSWLRLRRDPRGRHSHLP